MSAIIGIAALGSFTFHYVSINTGKSREERFIDESLHPTMFLLIRRYLPEKDPGTQLYIPLCFY